MTVNTTNITSGPYDGNDVADTFSYTFRIEDKSQLKVFETNDEGVETTLTVDTDYTVAGIGNDAGGTLTRVAGPLPTGYQWYIRSDYKQTQLTAFSSQGAFFPEIHEAAMDKLTFLVQQLQDAINRTLRLSESYSGDASTDLPDPVAGQFFRWNADATALELVDLANIGTIPTTDLILVFDTVAAMQAYSAATGQVIYVKGVGAYVVVDSGEGVALVNGKVAVPELVGNSYHVNQFGALGDNVTDDTAAIQAAYNFVKTGGNLHYTPGATYYVEGTVVPQYPNETPLERHNLLEAGLPTAGPIEKINIFGHGATIRSTDADFNSSFPFSMQAFIGVDSVRVYGLRFESDTNNQTPDWFDSSNYFNQSPPTVEGNPGLYFVKFTGVTIKDCEFYHLSNGLLLTDDRNLVIPAGEEMTSFNSLVTGNKFFNILQGMSMTYGASAEMLIEGNHFKYTFIKLYQESDQGSDIQFKNNICRDMSGFLINCNNVQIINNSFNNLLGGFSLQPQGGTDPSTDYDYDMLGVTIRGNKCFSDHETDIDGGLGTARPQAFVIINATDTATAGQTVLVDDLNIEFNECVLWPLASSSNGGFINRAGTAEIQFGDVSVIHNKIDMKSADGVITSFAPQSAFSVTEFLGLVDFSHNRIKRPTGNNNFEFQFYGKTQNRKSKLRFNHNEIETMGQNRQVCVGNFHKFEALHNTFELGDASSATSAVFWLGSVTRVTIQHNDCDRDTYAGGNGYLLYLDGITSGVYDTVLDNALYRVNDNYLSEGQFVLASAIATFPTSAAGLYDLMGNTIQGSVDYDDMNYPTITGFTTENVVNPSKTTPTVTAGQNLIPAGYVVWRMDVGTGKDTGWLWDGAWNELGTWP